MISLAADDARLAETYDKLSDSQFESGSRLLGKLGLQPGHTAVDVGCGTGRLGARALEIVGPRGRLVGLDPLPERVAIAARRNPQGNARFHLGRGEDLSAVESGLADAIYLSAVYHWIIDKEKALAEFWRVLKPGGRLGLTTNPRELVIHSTLHQVTERVFAREPFHHHVSSNDFAPARHGVTTTGLVESFVAAGFSVSDVHIASLQRSYPDGRSVLDFVESSTFGNYLGAIPPELRDHARGEVVAELEKGRTARGIVLQQYTLFAVATKPAQTPALSLA